ncbi:MAG: DNA helicase II [Lysobacterales bacterium]
MDVSHLLDVLNPDQRAAVSAPAGHYLVLAGAGSGKTRVLVHRIAWLTLVERATPWSVLAVTFTNKAAGEMRGRAESLVREGGRGLTVGTFHGIAHRMLRRHWREAGLPEAFQILDQDDQTRLIKRVIADMNLDEARYTARQAAWYINAAKDEGKRPDKLDAGNNPFARTQRDIYIEYEARCRRLGLVDFAELLLRAYELWRNDPSLLKHYRERFAHLLVDEFQDTNEIQYLWVRELAGDTGQVFVVGDDDQAIYGWRGARVENVQRFLRDFPSARTLKLEQNYRSTANILGAANAIIAHNPDRLGKQLWTSDAAGDAIEVYAAYNEQDEARFITERIRLWVLVGGSPSDCALLYRSNAQSRVLEEQLVLEDIPYRVYGGLRFFDRAEVKDALAYLRLVASRDDDAAFERSVNTPPRGIGDRTMEVLRARARGAQVSLWQAALLELLGDGLAGRAKNALRAFMAMIDTLDHESAEQVLAERFEAVIVRSGLRAHHDRDSRGEGNSRADNLDELVSVASRFVLSVDDAEAGLSELTAFLANATLDAGEAQGGDHEACVQLMTLHAAKGLEFPMVFMVGLEDGLFPSNKSLDEHGRLEEERRLAYVGITRAQQRLVLTYAESRRLHGTENFNRPSRFLAELPRELLHEVRPKIHVTRPSSFGGGYASRDSRGSSLRDDDAPAFKLGQRVAHNTFGEGTVVSYEGGGAHTIVQVNFESGGSKRLVLAYANLRAIA